MQSTGGTCGTQKLIKCDTLNAAGERRSRYVELRIFNLWKYLMEHKHGLKVADPCLCLWVSESEFERKRDLFSHSGDKESVDRIQFTLFDDTQRFTSEVIRFVPSADTERTIDILRSHASEHLRENDSVEINTEAGYGIRQYKHVDSGPLVLALHVSS